MFVLWSPMTRHSKRTLDFDAPGSDRATSFAYQRASLNGALKTELVNDCLSDAVVYSGQHGDPIRAAMKLAACHELGGTLVAGQPCDLTSAGPGDCDQCASPPRAGILRSGLASASDVWGRERPILQDRSRHPPRLGPHREAKPESQAGITVAAAVYDRSLTSSRGARDIATKRARAMPPTQAGQPRRS